MKTYKRNKKKVALFDFEWSAVWVVIAVAIFVFTGFTWLNAVEIAAFALIYCLLFGRAVMSSYRKAVVIDDSGVRLENARDRLYTYNAPYEEITALNYAPSHRYGNPAIEIKLKSKDRVLIDGAFENAAELWENVIDSVLKHAPETPVDARVTAYIEKLKKKAPVVAAQTKAEQEKAAENEPASQAKPEE